MRGGDLTAAQLKKLRDCLRPKIDYLAKDRERMEARHFADTDRLYRAVRMSHEHLREVMFELDTLISYKGFQPPDVNDIF